MSLLKKIIALFNPWPEKKRRKKKKGTRRKRQAVRKKGGKKKKSAHSSLRGGRRPATGGQADLSAERRARQSQHGIASVASLPRNDAKGAKLKPKKQSQRKPALKKVLPKLIKVDSKKVMIGEVTHYFDRAKVAAFMITGAPVAIGDLLEFKGKTASFKQKVVSLQINRTPVPSARAGDEVGMLVKKPVREGDYVFKMKN